MTLRIRDAKHPRKKVGNDQEVPLLGPAWDLLEEIPKLDGLILPYKTESMTAAFKRVVVRIAETGMPGIADLRFHDLRHTGITILFWRGLQIQEVAVVSGHSNGSQLKRYTHIRPEDLHRHFPRPTANAPFGTPWNSLSSDAQEHRAAGLRKARGATDFQSCNGGGGMWQLCGLAWTKGYSVMRGYWGDEERTRESIVNGWMRTGDLATIDAYGYCNIVGRLKDMLIRGGENIYPREIEEFLYGHPSIAEVQVFGVPDSK